jgi:hypothetical protein
MLHCPIDGRITECVVTVYVWYDPTVQCARCGESWSGGQMAERPFARGWRAKQQRRVRALWDETPHGPFPSLAEMDPSLAAPTEETP